MMYLNTKYTWQMLQEEFFNLFEQNGQNGQRSWEAMQDSR